jgi:hypothetical protein
VIDASRVRQSEAEEVFDLRERQDHRVRVSMFQVLIQRLIFARHRVHPRETVSSAQFARENRVERLFENVDG